MNTHHEKPRNKIKTLWQFLKYLEFFPNFKIIKHKKVETRKNLKLINVKIVELKKLHKNRKHKKIIVIHMVKQYITNSLDVS